MQISEGKTYSWFAFTHTYTLMHTYVCVCVCVGSLFYFICSLWIGQIFFGPICLGFLPLQPSFCLVDQALNVLQIASDSAMTLLCHNHILIFCYSYLLQMKPCMLFIIPTPVYWFTGHLEVARFLYIPSLLFSVLKPNYLKINNQIMQFNYRPFNKPLR